LYNSLDLAVIIGDNVSGNKIK